MKKKVKKIKKIPKLLKKQALKYKIRLTRTINGKRIRKSEKMLKTQIKNKQKTKKNVKRNVKYGVIATQFKSSSQKSKNENIIQPSRTISNDSPFTVVVYIVDENTNEKINRYEITKTKTIKGHADNQKLEIYLSIDGEERFFTEKYFPPPNREAYPIYILTSDFRNLFKEKNIPKPSIFQRIRGYT